MNDAMNNVLDNYAAKVDLALAATPMARSRARWRLACVLLAAWAVAASVAAVRRPPDPPAPQIVIHADNMEFRP